MTESDGIIDRTSASHNESNRFLVEAALMAAGVETRSHVMVDLLVRRLEPFLEILLIIGRFASPWSAGSQTRSATPRLLVGWLAMMPERWAEGPLAATGCS